MLIIKKVFLLHVFRTNCYTKKKPKTKILTEKELLQLKRIILSVIQGKLGSVLQFLKLALFIYSSGRLRTQDKQNNFKV